MSKARCREQPGVHFILFLIFIGYQKIWRARLSSRMVANFHLPTVTSYSRLPEAQEDIVCMKLWPDKSSGCNYNPFIEDRWHSERRPEEDSSAPEPVPKPSLRRTMSLGTFHLMQTLKNSPAALRRRFRRDRTESLSHGDPLFKVHYLGTEKIFSLDREQAQDAIGRLLERAANGKKLGKDHALVVRPRYIEVKELSTGRQLTKTYLQDIAYCAADANRPNVFLYICKHHGQQLQCRVFWCSRAERARDMTACLAHSFQQALSDWQQDGSATFTPREVKGKGVEEMPSTPATAKSYTLPASLGKVRWKKRGSVSRSPLRAITRRGSASDSWN